MRPVSRRPLRPGSAATAETPAPETFSITTQGIAQGCEEAGRCLAARGALTQLGGELVYCAISDLVGAGFLDMTIDLSLVTSIEDAGLRLLRRAWLRVQAAGGCLRTVGLAEGYLHDPDQLRQPGETANPAFTRLRQGSEREPESVTAIPSTALPLCGGLPRRNPPPGEAITRRHQLRGLCERKAS